MPTNLPPEYFRAEQTFREVESTSAKVAALEEMMSTIPKHKGTDKLRAELRRKISKLKEDQQRKKVQASTIQNIILIKKVQDELF